MEYYSANDFRYYQENSLSHHGVLGMKWGVRRYQNEDGTLKNKKQSKLLKRGEKLVEKKHYDNKKIKRKIAFATLGAGLTASQIMLFKYTGNIKILKAMSVVGALSMAAPAAVKLAKTGRDILSVHEYNEYKKSLKED